MQKFSNMVRAVKQKWGPAALKQTMWNDEYQSGKWRHCEKTPDAHVYRFIERYCRNGSVLDLGCGAGNTGNEIDMNRYADYTGIDISSVAIKKAEDWSIHCGRSCKNKYIQSSIESYVPEKKHDVIVFRECIYYLPYSRIEPTLDRYRGYLSDNGGVFIVDASEFASKLARPILSLLEANYTVVEKFEPQNLDYYAYVLVFR